MIPSSLYPLVTALLSNVLAQVGKTVVYYYRTGKWDLHWVIASGGFPSSHSSTVTALSLSIGIQEGFDSAIFAVTTIFSFIVMFDACAMTEMIKEGFHNVKEVSIFNIGTVIGAHTGPGTIAVFFKGNKRAL